MHNELFKASWLGGAFVSAEGVGSANQDGQHRLRH